jgi:hypothetical protein
MRNAIGTTGETFQIVRIVSNVNARGTITNRFLIEPVPGITDRNDSAADDLVSEQVMNMTSRVTAVPTVTPVDFVKTCMTGNEAQGASITQLGVESSVRRNQDCVVAIS